MNEPRLRYISYLLRLWQVMCEEGPAWRASLEDTRTGERQGFANLDALLDYLIRRTGEIAATHHRKGMQR
jgi:hypothetical protein